MNRELKRKLDVFRVPDYDTDKLEKTIMKTQKIKLHPEIQRMTNAEFFFNQLGFIQKKTWILKCAFSAFVLYLIFCQEIDIISWIWTLIALSGPVLCMINAKEICNVFQPGMLELQMTAKNSFRKVLVVRLIIFGLVDLVFLICAAVMMTSFQNAELWQVIIYGTVPYELMCFGCLAILNRSREENVLLYSASWGVFLSCIIITLRITGFEIYAEQNFIVWVFLGLLAICGGVCELNNIMKRVGGNVNEINNGAFV